MEDVMSYAQKLSEMGIVVSRIEDITTAMDSLHKALSKLDNSQLTLFGQNFGILGHLDLYAREEHLRNVANEMYMTKLRKSIRNIDFDEFPDFADKLNYLAEAASELGIPGAHQLCKSIRDIKSVSETNKLPFARLAKKVLNIAKVSGRHFNYNYLYDPQDNCIGKALTIYSVVRKNEGYESGYDLAFVNVELDNLDVDSSVIRNALNNTLRSGRCGHEHDCCGCVRSYPLSMKRLLTNIHTDVETWVVKMAWSRNV